MWLWGQTVSKSYLPLSDLDEFSVMIQCRICDEDLILPPCDCCLTIQRTWYRFCETRFILAKISYLRGNIGEWWAACSGRRYMKVLACPPLYELFIVRLHGSMFIPRSLGTWERIWTVLRLCLGQWLVDLGCGLLRHRARGRTATAAWAGRSYVARFWIEALCPSAQLVDTRSWLAATAMPSSTPKWSLFK
jgi:hypothetical protein